jgi:hypothetical protein
MCDLINDKFLKETYDDDVLWIISFENSIRFLRHRKEGKADYTIELCIWRYEW